MIELPEAAVLAKQINQTLPGRQIWQVIANQSPHKCAWYLGDPPEYNARLAGTTMRGAEAFGGHIQIRADDMLIVISTPIRYHAYPGKLGVVEVGALGDLILVDGDPIGNIKLVADPTKNFMVIMKDGQTYKNTLR